MSPLETVVVGFVMLITVLAVVLAGVTALLLRRILASRPAPPEDPEGHTGHLGRPRRPRRPHR